ncbi:hypothetical protein N7467_007783 [Penicillium canescens]|nr:hypothetical protein N7467_007783 [Penicillium canescens]
MDPPTSDGKPDSDTPRALNPASITDSEVLTLEKEQQITNSIAAKFFAEWQSAIQAMSVIQEGLSVPQTDC